MSVLDRARLFRRGVRLGGLFDALVDVHGDRRLVTQAEPISLTGGLTELDHGQAAAVVARASEVLAPRCHGGRRMVVRGGNDYGFFLACVAVARAGGVVVPVNPRMRDEEVDYVVEDAGAEIVDVATLGAEVDASDATGASPAADSSDEVAGIFYTSGTTGKPKGAELTHDALVNPASMGVLWPSGLRRDEVVVALPIAHIMGFAALVGAAGTGVPVYFLPHFSPRAVLDAIEERRSTVFIGVPAMYRMLLEAGAEGRDLSSVRVWISGADVMPPDLARRFKKMGAAATLPFVGRTVGEATFAQGYGMVELGGASSMKVSPPGTSLGLGDFLGLSMLGWDTRVVDEAGNDVDSGEVGELLVKGPHVLRRYHGDPEKTSETVTDEGWVRTGDLARRGRFGTVRFAGRKKDVLMHGGYSVYPAEVEEALRAHPGVADAAVVGRPDEVKGEVPVAFVRREPGSALDEQSVIAHAGEHLADYKVPARVVFVDEFPRTGTGKVAKQVLREQLDSD